MNALNSKMDGAGDENPTSWAVAMSHTDMARLNMARVFVINPECLLFHKPVQFFDEVEALKVLSILRAHVDEKGIELSAEKRPYRRPRTVFMTCTTIAVSIRRTPCSRSQWRKELSR